MWIGWVFLQSLHPYPVSTPRVVQPALFPASISDSLSPIIYDSLRLIPNLFPASTINPGSGFLQIQALVYLFTVPSGWWGHIKKASIPTFTFSLTLLLSSLLIAVT